MYLVTTDEDSTFYEQHADDGGDASAKKGISDLMFWGICLGIYVAMLGLAGLFVHFTKFGMCSICHFVFESANLTTFCSMWTQNRC